MAETREADLDPTDPDSYDGPTQYREEQAARAAEGDEKAKSRAGKRAARDSDPTDAGGTVQEQTRRAGSNK